ncbi:MAG: AAA family ATPase, partial [Acinetobacter sp.]
MTIKISNIAIGGYRSFGSIQYFSNFKKINLFIGRNNSGKSNILRFINNIYATRNSKEKYKQDPIDRHFPNGGDLIIGAACYPEEAKYNLIGYIKNKFTPEEYPRIDDQNHQSILKIYNEVAKIEQQDSCWTLFNFSKSRSIIESWSLATQILTNDELYRLWGAFTRGSNGDRNNHWSPQTIEKLNPALQHSNESHFIPAIRQIALSGNNESTGYDGSGIINKLAKLQNPDVLNQDLRKRFLEINYFVQSVLDRKDATIEIPYDRNTILVHMDNKVLPLDSLGTGVHEVIILAAAATTLNDTILCIEEPELHLNPVLQRKLLKYLSE